MGQVHKAKWIDEMSVGAPTDELVHHIPDVGVQMYGIHEVHAARLESQHGPARRYRLRQVAGRSSRGGVPPPE